MSTRRRYCDLAPTVPSRCFLLRGGESVIPARAFESVCGRIAEDLYLDDGSWDEESDRHRVKRWIERERRLR
jgi:hypothetical protein